MKRRIQITVLFIAATLAAWVWLKRGHDHAVRSAQPRGIVLISIDTLRADRLGCYGYDKPTSPHIDALAREALRYTNAVAPVALTLPSHATMLTGVIPPQHGVRGNLHFRLGESNVTLAEQLAPAGYRAGGFVSSYVLDPQFGLGQGFEHYSGVLDLTLPSPDAVERSAADTTAEALRWLEGAGDAPFFLFLHLYDPHFPYEAPPAFAERFDDPYDAEIAYADAHVGKVVERLRETGLYDDVLLIVTADHGESLGEHGEQFHGFFCYQSTLHVPLIVKPAGGVKAGVIDRRVGIADIAPTVLAAAGLEPEQVLDGRDLLAEGDVEPVYFESLRPTTEGANPIAGLADRRWKFIMTKRPELYDLEADPGEVRNQLEVEPAPARRLHKQLKQTLLDRSREAADSGLTLDAAAVERLRSLGYVGGAATTGAMLLEIDDSLADPKDVIHIVESNQQVFALIEQAAWSKAEALALQLTNERPADPQPRMAMARIKEQQGDLEGAAAAYRAAIERIEAKQAASGVVRLADDHNSARYNLAVLYEKMQDTEAAIATWHALLADAPQFLDAHYKFAHLLAQQGRVAEAAEHLRAVIDLRPDHAQAHYNLANALSRQGDLRGAARHYEQAIRHGLSTAQSHNNYAITAARLGRPDVAIEHWRFALKRDASGDERPQIFINLAIALKAIGKTSEADAAWQDAIEAARQSGRPGLVAEIEQRRAKTQSTGPTEHQ